MSIPTGFTRREMYVDARDLQSDADSDNPLSEEEYKALLAGRGKEKMAEKRLVKSFSAVVRTVRPTYSLGEDFLIGDTITVTDDKLSVTADAVVSGVERSIRASGEEELTLTFGIDAPTIYDLLKRKA